MIAVRPNRDREAIFVGHKWAEEKAAALEGMAAIRSQANVPLRAGLSGAEVAGIVLRRGGLTGTHIEESVGWLSDHYDPTTRTLRGPASRVGRCSGGSRWTSAMAG